MAKRVRRIETPLARPVDLSELVRVVPHLAPETLHQLIRHRGLEACAEIVASATPRQLASVLDLDLWRSAQPGRDERFDAERFGEWLELLMDAGETVAARIVAHMDEHLVVAGLSRYVRVFDPATLDGQPADGDETSPGGPECDVGGYLVRGIAASAWDAIVALLIALDSGHPDRFHAVMRACRRLSNSTPEVDGLHDLLLAPDQLLHDVAQDRERRRSQQGYSTPADARAFLRMARRRRPHSADAPPINPLVAAYFRSAEETIAAESDAARDGPRGTPVSPATLAVPDAPDDVVDILFRSGLVGEQPRPRLVGPDPPPSPVALVRTLIAYVNEHDGTLSLARSHELAFLANTLIAGCSIQSRPFTPQEASDAAVGICNLGLEHWPEALPATFLMGHDLVSAFEVGWAVLHEDVGMFTAEQLVLALSNLRHRDAHVQKGIRALRTELTKQRAAGTPWRAREALEVIGMLDMPAWASVSGLLDECPVMPAALTATLEGRTGAISATDFEFIATRSQLGLVREFLARLPGILRRS